MDDKIQELEAAVAENPENVPARIKLADLYRRRGERAKAIPHYTFAASHYSAQGRPIKAMMLLKQVLKLDRDQTGARESLAQLYVKGELYTEALGHYRTIVRHYESRGMTMRAVEALHKILDIASDDDWAIEKLRSMSPAQ